MRVRVLFFSVLREAVGAASCGVELAEGATGEDLWEALVARFPALRPYRAATRLAVNEAYAPVPTVLHDADTVALITPTSGG